MGVCACACVVRGILAPTRALKTTRPARACSTAGNAGIHLGAGCRAPDASLPFLNACFRRPLKSSMVTFIRPGARGAWYRRAYLAARLSESSEKAEKAHIGPWSVRVVAPGVRHARALLCRAIF